MPEFYPSLRARAIECPECGTPTIAEPKGFVISGGESYPDNPLSRWTLFACESSHPILVVENEDDSDWVDNEVESAYFDDNPSRAYPPQERLLSDEIPNRLREIHGEARACIRAKAFTAAVVMSGRVLEGVCELHEIQGRTLHDQLRKMKESGMIDGRLWDWAEALRSVRNSAAHFTNDDSIGRQDAEDAVAFTEALLDYLYVLTARFNAFKERRIKNSNQAISDKGSKEPSGNPNSSDGAATE